MHDGCHVIAGDCTAAAPTDDETTHRGDVVVVVKPDNTVLVHDASGYQPVAWLTRADSVTITEGVLEARDGDRRLRVNVHREHGRGRYPVTRAGEPLADCRDCQGTLVEGGGAVTCTDCDAEYGLPSDATVTDDCCDDCGLPTVRIERGEAFAVCLDRDCDSLDDRVRAAFQGEWDCPACDRSLQIIRRGGLMAGCPAYPDCETEFGIPRGLVVDECDCGLPVFETPSGRRCLDAACERVPASPAD